MVSCECNLKIVLYFLTFPEQQFAGGRSIVLPLSEYQIRQPVPVFGAIIT